MSVMIHLDGRLIGPWVEEVRSTISVALTRENLCINLENLSFADDAGIALLRTYRRTRVPLVGASPWIERLLANDPQEIIAKPSPKGTL